MAVSTIPPLHLGPVAPCWPNTGRYSNVDPAVIANETLKKFLYAFRCIVAYKALVLRT